jgi:hypothetical protein
LRAGLAQPVLQFVQLEGFDDGLDPLHGAKHPPEHVAGVFPADEISANDPAGAGESWPSAPHAGSAGFASLPIDIQDGPMNCREMAS